jgi:hypothetical protein
VCREGEAGHEQVDGVLALLRPLPLLRLVLVEGRLMLLWWWGGGGGGGGSIGQLLAGGEIELGHRDGGHGGRQ